MFQVQDYNDLFLCVYVFVDDALKDMEQQLGVQLKTRSDLSISETLTIQIVGEFMEKKTEMAIYMLLREYKDLFSAVISRSSFYKQLKKCVWLLELLIPYLSEKFDADDDVCIPDGFPIPIKKLARKNKGVNVNGRANVGFCASLKEYFYGLKGHILVGANGIIHNLLLSPASVHDVNLLEPLLENEQDKIVICDKGYVGKKHAEAVALNNNIIVIEKKKNQTGQEKHNKAIRPLMKKRKIVESVISHLERLNSKTMKQRSFWTIKMRMLSKCLAISSAIAYNIENGLEKLLCMKILHPEFL